ncbi:acetyltransferase [Pseudomonas cedrina subsp. fulgida]|nr:acetyltransferase [Pseudomonas cedrina subsp. fulgida]
MGKILLVGSSGHAKVILDIVEKQGLYTVLGLIDSFRAIGDEVLGYSVIGRESDLPKILAEYSVEGVIVAIGDNSIRGEVSARISELCPHLPFVCAIHPSATIGKGVSIGSGTVVMAGAVVNPCSAVGKFCIINTLAALDHDSVMGDFSSLAPSAVTGGGCKIGKFSAIGIGASLSHGVNVGEHAVVGGKSMVLSDVDPFSVYYGVPAKRIRSRQKSEKYL